MVKVFSNYNTQASISLLHTFEALLVHTHVLIEYTIHHYNMLVEESCLLMKITTSDSWAT